MQQNVFIGREDILTQFLSDKDSHSDPTKRVNSLHLTHDSYLGSMANEAFSTSTDSWKEDLLHKIQSIKYLDTMDESELDAFKNAISSKLVVRSMKGEKDNVFPSILQKTPDSTKGGQKVTVIYNNASKKKLKVTLDLLAEITSTIPTLKNIKFDNINFKVERDDSMMNNDNDYNSIESVEISLGNTVTSPATLLNSIVASYHKNLKRIKLVTGERKDKWLPYNGGSDDLVDIMSFQTEGIELKHLESVDISFFGYLIDTDRFLDELAKTKSKLKDLTLRGCVYGRSVLYTITNYYYQSLESLELSTEYYCNLSSLKTMEKLTHFSYVWENLEEKVDIIKILMMVPNLTSLKLGYSKIHGDLINNMTNFEVYNNLFQLSLQNLNLLGTEVDRLAEQLPNLREIYFTKCKFGKSKIRLENEATLFLKNFTLKKLILDSCSLYYSKKEVKNKRPITKFKFDILQQEPYAVALESTLDENKKGSILADGDRFMYQTSNEKENTLIIKITSLGTFSTCKSMQEYVVFVPEGDVDGGSINGNKSMNIQTNITLEKSANTLFFSLFRRSSYKSCRGRNCHYQ